MPCRDAGGPSKAELDKNKKDVMLKNAQKRVELLESLLCSSCRALHHNKFDFSLNPRLDEWWSKHKEEDLNREEAEARKDLRRKAGIEISKKPFNELTKEDKAILKELGYL